MSWTFITSTTVGAGGASNIEFTSIPNSYKKLILIMSLRGNNSEAVVNVSFTLNNNTSTIYTRANIWGDGSTVNRTQGTADDRGYWGYMNANTATASTFGNAWVEFINYATTATKVWNAQSVTENDATLAHQTMAQGSYDSSSAISSIKINPWSTGNFMQYSTAYLYGVK